MARGCAVRDRTLAVSPRTHYNEDASCVYRSMDLKARFYKVYNNLPLNLRDEVVLVIQNEPVTWKVARLEVDQDTKLSRTILEKLVALGVI